jgi:hypothetical protein
MMDKHLQQTSVANESALWFHPLSFNGSETLKEHLFLLVSSFINYSKLICE